MSLGMVSLKTIDGIILARRDLIRVVRELSDIDLENYDNHKKIHPNTKQIRPDNAKSAVTIDMIGNVFCFDTVEEVAKKMEIARLREKEELKPSSEKGEKLLDIAPVLNKLYSALNVLNGARKEQRPIVPFEADLLQEFIESAIVILGGGK